MIPHAGTDTGTETDTDTGTETHAALAGRPGISLRLPDQELLTLT